MFIPIAREVSEVHTSLQNLIFIVNIITASSKRHGWLEANYIVELKHLVEIGHIDIRWGVNQTDTLQCPKNTR